VEIAGGFLPIVGLLAVPVAVILCLTAAVGYVAGPRRLSSPWPMRNGGEEAVLYCAVMIYFADAWSVDARLHRASPNPRVGETA
jgi:uncharacterized membrane protein YphA (DoxX/SURF4 family)